ncbi:hypothetical protein HY489_03860 [Candidatus Woesearchaeota archaeon]|nr:hypothetical protein [Candidatus Woesearchaeota archaeon]
MKALFSILVVAVFALGVGVGALMSLQQPDLDVQAYTATSRALTFQPVQLSENKDAQPLSAVAQPLVLEGPIERISPGDWVKESQIDMREDGVFIRFNHPQWAILADTNSMDPVFDEDSHLIQAIPLSKDEIQVGDIMSYESPMGFTIVHRVIEIGQDEDGWYAILKGDNNPVPDPWKVRFDMVKRVTVMVVY